MLSCKLKKKWPNDYAYENNVELSELTEWRQH